MLRQIQPVLTFAAGHLDEDLSLAALAGKAGLSTFHLHRVFSMVTGETPKQFTLRLRLARAAALLLTTGDSVLDVALECGFGSHEAFCRAFRKRFQMTPSAYRLRGFAGQVQASEAPQHAAVVASVGPCIRLFHPTTDRRPQKNDMAYSITKKEIAAQPVIVVRRRIKPSEVAAALAEGLGHVFMHAQKYGIALAGQPFTRYLEWGPGLWTIEAGMPVTAHSCDTPAGVDVYPGALPGGLVATTTHIGAYDKLSEAHAALEQWIEAEGLAAAGAAWEVYITDPADYPDPGDWKTEIFWPVRENAQRERSEMAKKPVVYKMQGMDGVRIRRDIQFQIAETGPLTMNLYSPPDATTTTRLPAVIFVFGYSDVGAERAFGCKLQEMEAYISWAKLVAATGLIAITYVNHDPVRDLDALFGYVRENAAALGVDEKRIGLWSCSGNVPRALGALLEGGDPGVLCAALCYGCMLDLDGATGVAEAAQKWHFANPTAGKTVRDLRADVPLFIARAGRDTPEMNQGIDRFTAQALAANLPVTVANHPTGPHAFDVLDDSETSRQIIRQILAFLRIHLPT